MGFELKNSERQEDKSGRGREMWTSLGAVSGYLQKKGLKKPYCLLEPSSKQEILRDLGEGQDADGEHSSCCMLVYGAYPIVLSR